MKTFCEFHGIAAFREFLRMRGSAGTLTTTGVYLIDVSVVLTIKASEESKITALQLAASGNDC